MTSPSLSLAEEANRTALRQISAGFMVIVFGLGGFILWAALTNISGAVIGSGFVAVESKVKKIQHPTGGVVTEILVRNGNKVVAGDLLVRLDETVNRANLQMISKQLDELIIREARLEAERDGLDQIIIPVSYQGRQSEQEIARRISSETAFFESRGASIRAQKNQLRERIQQLNQEIKGMLNQIESKKLESTIVKQEIDSLADLIKKKLVTAPRVNALRRDASRLDGERAQLESALAEIKSKIAEIDVELLRIDQDFRTSIIQELRDNRAEQAGLIERKIAAEDALKRVELRAPQSGTVHELTMNTVGGVINAGETIMQIVPDNDELIVETRIAPHDIDQVLNGDQTAYIRFSAFNHQLTPEIIGRVLSISADLSVDQYTGSSFYVVRISVQKDELAKLENKRLVPGMPAEIFIKTEERSALSYFVKPIQDHFARAFRER